MSLLNNLPTLTFGDEPQNEQNIKDRRVHLSNKFPQKIHIIGSVGSGKTTLAKELSAKLNMPYYELDNVVWNRQSSGDIRRTDQQKVDYLNNIFLTDAWII